MRPMQPVLGTEISIGGRRWSQKLNDGIETERIVYTIAQRYDLPDVIARLLVSRHVPLEEVNGFLNPKLRDIMPDPSSLTDMDVAVDRLVKAISGNELIGLFADYDVDGATSSALLKMYLDALNIRSELYIPDRIKDGYGPNKQGLEYLKNKGADLIITLDCGILAFDVLDDFYVQGGEVIVIDHHMAEPKLPKAIAVVNPNRLDDLSDLGNLAAVGVVFLLLVALTRKLRKIGWFSKKTEPNLLQWLDLVAIGTICDVVELKGLNRAFVAQGLKVMALQKNIGVKALREVALVNSKPNSYQVGFMLGPRINAAGRVGESELGARLLACDDEMHAINMSNLLDEQNKLRQQIESSVLEQALSLLNEDNEKENVIVVAADNWHPGVIGIVSARLREKFNKPACVVSIQNGIGKGSGRSISGWDLGSAIIGAVQSGLLKEGGGHKMAAGFSVRSDKVFELKQYLNDHFNRSVAEADNVVSLPIDGLITVAAVKEELLELLERLEPFGAGNPEPRFVIPSLRVKYATVVGDQHIKCRFVDKSSGEISGICFRSLGTKIGNVLLNQNGTPVHVAGKIRRNLWQGRASLQVIIDDIAIPKITENL